MAGHLVVFCAHGGNELRAGRLRVALKMVKVDESMLRTMSEQEKLVKRSAILATRTRTLILCNLLMPCHGQCAGKMTYQVTSLLFVRLLFVLVQRLFFFPSRAKWILGDCPRRRPRRPQRALERRSGCDWDLGRMTNLHRLCGGTLADVAKTDIGRLRLSGEVLCG